MYGIMTYEIVILVLGFGIGWITRYLSVNQKKITFNIDSIADYILSAPDTDDVVKMIILRVYGRKRHVRDNPIKRKTSID